MKTFYLLFPALATTHSHNSNIWKLYINVLFICLNKIRNRKDGAQIDWMGVLILRLSRAWQD
jgi:hypothetical protein